MVSILTQHIVIIHNSVSYNTNNDQMLSQNLCKNCPTVTTVSIAST